MKELVPLIAVIDRTFRYSARLLTDADLQAHLQSIHNTVSAYLDPEWTDFDQFDADRWQGHGSSLTSYGMIISDEIKVRVAKGTWTLDPDIAQWAQNVLSEFVGLQYLLLDLGHSVVIPDWARDDDMQGSDLVVMIRQGSDREHYISVLKSQYPVGISVPPVEIPMDLPHFVQPSLDHVAAMASVAPEDSLSDPWNNKKSGALIATRLDVEDYGVPAYRAVWWRSARSGLHIRSWLKVMADKLLQPYLYSEHLDRGIAISMADLLEDEGMIKNCTISNKPFFSSSDFDRSEPMFKFILPLGASNDHLLEKIQNRAPQEESEGIFDLFV